MRLHAWPTQHIVCPKQNVVMQACMEVNSHVRHKLLRLARCLFTEQMDSRCPPGAKVPQINTKGVEVGRHHLPHVRHAPITCYCCNKIS